LNTRNPKAHQPVLEHGRRTVIDFASETVRRILDAAESLFAENCYAGTRMDDIAAAAGVNKATIYYHIGGKDKLYNVVLTRHFAHFADRLENELAGCDDPLEGLRGVVRIHAEEFSRNTNAPRTIAHELAGGSSRTTPEVAACYARIHNTTARFVEMGIARGTMRRIDPTILNLVLAGSMLINTITAPFRDKLAPTLDADHPPMPSPHDMAAFLETIVIPSLAVAPDTPAPA
jgi:AcrR family transcriptional regulator